MNVVKRLFKIQNINASTIRTVMVAHCRRHDTPDLLLDYEAQSKAQAQRTQQHQPLFFDLGNTDSEEEEDEEDEEDEARGEKRVSAHLPSFNPSRIQHVIHVRTIGITAPIFYATQDFYIYNEEFYCISIFRFKVCFKCLQDIEYIALLGKWEMFCLICLPFLKKALD